MDAPRRMIARPGTERRGACGSSVSLCGARHRRRSCCCGFVVIPQFVDASHDLDKIRGLAPWPLLLGLALELASLAAYGALTCAFLDPRDRPRYGTVLEGRPCGVA